MTVSVHKYVKSGTDEMKVQPQPLCTIPALKDMQVVSWLRKLYARFSPPGPESEVVRVECVVNKVLFLPFVLPYQFHSADAACSCFIHLLSTLCNVTK